MSTDQVESSRNRNAWINWAIYCLFVISINSIYLLAQYDVFRPDGSNGWLLVTMFLGIPLFLALLMFVISFIAIFFRSRRAEARKYLIASLIYIVCAMGFLVAGVYYRRHAYRTLAIKGEVIIEAIRNYENQYGSPPKTLENLVPEYLSEIPVTGIATHPEYGYIVSGVDDDPGSQITETHKTRWAIYVTAPSMATDWRCCLYVSDLRYDNIQAGYQFEEIKDWVLFEGVPDSL